MKITEAYARMVARNAYFWAWPMVNIYNRRLAFEQVSEPGLMNGVLPVAPVNRLSMLHDYVKPQQRWVACPNQDVVYGAGVLALEKSPVVVQIPAFGSRFWVCQLVDIRTDSFGSLGAMHGTKPGFYLLANPDWEGETPAGIEAVFRAGSNTGMVVPRVFQDDTADDRLAIQDVISGIDVYPLAEFDGRARRRDWSQLPTFGQSGSGEGEGETQWVRPATFFDQLPQVLADARPLAGEETIYRQLIEMLEAARADRSLKAAMIDEARLADEELVAPLLQFRNWGIPLGNYWSKVDDGAAFELDYFARTAVARSNILVNAPAETQYLYQDLDSDGRLLNGGKHYEVTFPKGETPPAEGFWSLSLYDDLHFFVPNPIDRYSLGTKNKTLRLGRDGSLTIYVQSKSPGEELEGNWLPAPPAGDFSLFLRSYWPKPALLDGSWTPPPVRRVS